MLTQAQKGLQGRDLSQLFLGVEASTLNSRPALGSPQLSGPGVPHLNRSRKETLG